MIRANVWVPADEGDGDGDLSDGALEVERTDSNEIRLAFRARGEESEHTAFLTLFDAGRLAGELEAAADGDDS